jgi:CheY-like chemotaxis protein
MKDGGKLEIVLGPFYGRDSWVKTHPGMREGQYILLQVSDTGHGMPPDVLSRAFEPFFTTKETGTGSGLGLAMVHGIMREHEGLVELESKEGVGTTVRCLFPAIEGAPAPSAVSSAPAETPAGRGERVLFLDDEPALARLGARRLGDLGYLVTAVTDPAKVPDMVRQGTFDLIITDYTMPRTTGLDLARRLQTGGSTVPVILLSGVATELDQAELAGAGIVRVLAKPVGSQTLGVTIREVLDEAADRRAGR